jgi:putative endonuclease
MAYKEYEFFVYILSSKSRTLYAGVTNDLTRRVQQHKDGKSSFTKRYKINRLVYFERFPYIDKAIARESQLKNWSREEKFSLSKAKTQHGKIYRLNHPKDIHPGKN